ncbi:multidrug resistance efflux transporter family protein [Clostridium estertheticum]|uniref:Multidrug resistance efflux transporter family protein n=1 Tax=Clostridium estertheticum TaxID=238834 RepID=A0AA47EFF4_9CLOT|nr:multidrug resistance efflux transporter family protein [Clostridium estertheticum]MBU3155663.1 multidrug resistance efflux transporter family protein [Clostridium estertheticum]MBU3199977.1 multidrug resistance efflux transporter family protein [Clostridium estertheticum]WAG59021.1 multidrug resistance efflux transporter family protein [Clostridium estertheticum]WAG66928.1 multidrug resistance efflux transporter family protein [Clostridium estertheticum]
MPKALILGIAASFFFAFTFILNQQMNISGGSWLWSSSLRFIFMFPILLVIMIIKNQLFGVLNDIIKKPIQWIIWSTVGFGLFYAPLTFASAYGSSWLVAGTWQITIVAGALLTPLFFKNVETEDGIFKIRNKIPKKSLLMSSVILLGIFLIQFQQAKDISALKAFIGILPVILAAFSYPLGNRKMIEVCNNRFSTFQRVFGMTLCSMPFWIIISLFSLLTVGLPSEGQVVQSLLVAIFSGIIATILFFKATDLVSSDVRMLAVVESTQSGEVIFTLLGGVFIFHDKIPTLIGLIGIMLVVIGMILNSLIKS